MPDTAEEAVHLAASRAVALTEFVTVSSVAREKFEHIIGCKLGPRPEASPVFAGVNLEDVPF